MRRGGLETPSSGSPDRTEIGAAAGRGSRETNASLLPSGDQASPPSDSERSARTTGSPGSPIGMTSSRCRPAAERVNASRVPSGDQAGLASESSPAVNGRAGDDASAGASQIALR